MATEGVEGLALLEAYTAAVRNCQAAHAQAPVELGVQRNVAGRATEDSVVDEVLCQSLAVLGRIPGDIKIVRGGQQRCGGNESPLRRQQCWFWLREGSL